MKSLFNWKKIGKIVSPLKNSYWTKSHCMLPTPVNIKKNIFRIFYTSRNKQNQSFITFTDIKISDEIKIIKHANKPVLSPGQLGCFDDNGVTPSSVIKIGKKIYLYYVGWKPKSTTRYSLMGGLAISTNNGKTFKRYSRSSIFQNNDREPFQIMTAPYVIKTKNDWKLWYVSCEKWKDPNYPIYNIKYASSKDGLKWKQTGKISINLKKNERAVARPSVIYLNKRFYMWYCKENKVGQYNMGFAISKNGINWKRVDNKVGIIKSKKGWDSEMIAYPNVIFHQKKYYMFYNGNEYGKHGFGVAISENFPKN
jgi:predicted GH43/DUF377 family glycosyl hydrolase